MKLGFVFPGQGAQEIGMGKDIYEKYYEVKKIYDLAKEITGVDVADLTFNTTEESLSQTKNTQIAILVMSLGILEILKENKIEADISCGLSLGEYTALIYSRIIELEEGIKIVQKRGKYMQEYVPEGEWSMAAVLGLDDEEVIEVCKKVKNGFVVPANLNCQGQIVVSGDKEGINEVMALAKEAGAKRVIELKTSGPFHTEKLERASKELAKELDKITINKISKKVIKNIDGTEYKEEDNIREILAKHVMSPVYFTKCIDEMLKQGVDTFVEIGPGKVLSGFIRKTNKEVKIYNINNLETLENTIKELKEEK